MGVTRLIRSTGIGILTAGLVGWATTAASWAEPLLQAEGQLEDGDRTHPSTQSRMDTYTFTGRAGQAISVVMESLEVDAYLWLMTPTGQVLAQNDNYDRTTPNAAIALTLPEDGLYILQVGASTPDARGRYRLIVEPLPDGQTTPIFSETAQRQAEAFAINQTGLQALRTGDFPQALTLFEDALAMRREIGDRRGEGITLTNLGSVYRAQGNYERALVVYEQALTIRTDLGDRRGEGVVLSNLAVVYENQGRYPEALTFSQEAQAIFAAVGDRRGEAAVLNNIGALQRNLGQYDAALSSYQRSLAIFTDPAVRQAIPRISQYGEGIALNNIGSAYQNLENYVQALIYYDRALTVRRESGDRAGAGVTLNNLGQVYEIAGQPESALTAYREAQAIFGEVGDRRNAALAQANIGALYSDQGNYSAALNTHQQALLTFRELGDPVSETVVLNNIGFTLDAMGETELAITLLKVAVNQWENLRGNLRQLDTEQQQAFTDRISVSYRLLADLLLQADRVLEAQEVLDLLKLQELDDYQIPNVRGSADISQGLALWEAEQAILNLFNQTLDAGTLQDLADFFKAAAVETQVTQLQRNARGQTLNPAHLVKLQDNLRQAGQTALLYPLILGDRLELVLVTPSGLVRETVAVDQVTLNGAIANFRADITDRRSNPLPNAQQLYQWLIAPIADDLEGIDTLLYAADGALRYIPLAALHDGEQWLTQRYTLNHITAASLTDFSPASPRDLAILAGAFPEENLAVQIGSDRVWFTGLPFAQAEVQNLAATIPNTTVFLSQAFNRGAIESRLNTHTIVHFATHAEFRSGHPIDSFILLGNGDRITLYDLNTWDLSNVDLVVLSACRTAVSGEALGNGEEILGFGYQIQRTGADAAIASLWYVDDGGTQTLMDAFYQSLRAGTPEATALRQAQIALLSPDNAQPHLAHPYYWAPFILIGNGL